MHSTYRHRQFPPVAIIVAIGGATLALIAWTLGLSVFLRPYFYPSLAFWSFAIFCLVSGDFKVWHRKVWKACQWWSGIWCVLFLLIFCAVPFSTALVAMALAAIALDGGVNPFLALAAHFMIWACATDILKTPPQSSI